MKKTSKIKAIIFDIGGVLYLNKKVLKKSVSGHYNFGVHQTIAKKLKLNLDNYFDSIDMAYAKSIAGEISEKKTISIISKNFKISGKKLVALYKKAYEEEFSLNKQLFEQALKLKNQGYKIAILSDQWHLSKKALVSNQLTKYFENLIVSCDVGLRKPNPKIYKLALKKLKLKPKECLFIDNRDWNLKPAKKLGMKTIFFKNNNQAIKELNKILKKHPV